MPAVGAVTYRSGWDDYVLRFEPATGRQLWLTAVNEPPAAWRLAGNRLLIHSAAQEGRGIFQVLDCISGHVPATARGLDKVTEMHVAGDIAVVTRAAWNSTVAAFSLASFEPGTTGVPMEVAIEGGVLEVNGQPADELDEFVRWYRPKPGRRQAGERAFYLIVSRGSMESTGYAGTVRKLRGRW